MPTEYHPGTAVEVQDAVASSGFRNKIANAKRYQRGNNVTIEQVCEMAYVGDYDRLEEILTTWGGNQLLVHHHILIVFVVACVRAQKT